MPAGHNCMGVAAYVLRMADTTRMATLGPSKTAILGPVNQRAGFWPPIRARLPCSARGRVALVPSTGVTIRAC